jgi:hypothetical protein
MTLSGQYAYVLNQSSNTLQAFSLNKAPTLQINNASGDNILSVDTTGAGNLLSINEINGTSALSISNEGNLQTSGSATFQDATNSTTAFQIQNSGGNDVLDADTTDGYIGIDTNSPGNLLSIGALTTAAGTYQIAVSTNGTTNSGIVVQTVASQSGGYAFNLQSSSGTSLASIDYQGNLNVKNATVTGLLTVNGHIVSGNSSGTTSAAGNTALGSTGSCLLTATNFSNGNDTAGTITLTPGGSGITTGTQCTVTFGSSYAAYPPASSNAEARGVYATATADNTFTIGFTSAGSSAIAYVFNYFVVQ